MSSTSQSSVSVATCTWEIIQFSRFNSGARLLGAFSASSSNNFYLKGYSKIAAADFASHLMILLKRNDPYESDVLVQCRLAILNGAQEKCFAKEFSANFRVYDESIPFDGSVYILNRAYILNPVNGLLQNDTLTVYCEVEVLSDQGKIVKPKELCSKNCEKITEDLNTLLESSKFSDVLFVIGDKEDEKKEFHLHKNILTTRSKVFNAMLTSYCEEKRKNRVEITDMSVHVFEEMIHYIYTGKTGPDLELYAQELFVAADKYQLDLLKSMAAHELASKLSIESVSGVLLLADMHSAQQLKMDCIKYITQHSKQVMQTEAWKMMIATRADLMLSLYEDLSNSK